MIVGRYSTKLPQSWVVPVDRSAFDLELDDFETSRLWILTLIVLGLLRLLYIPTDPGP